MARIPTAIWSCPEPMRKPALPHPLLPHPSLAEPPAQPSPEPGPPRTSEPIELAPSEAAGQQVALAGMAGGRRAVLSRLKAAGEATADQLAADLGITVGGVRQQLARSPTPG